jgi:hypothetical protein
MSERTPDRPSLTTNEGRLDGWKEIASHLGVSFRSAIRYEEQHDLPVHRTASGRVYAFRAEIDAWQKATERSRREADAQPGLEASEGTAGPAPPTDTDPREGTLCKVAQPSRIGRIWPSVAVAVALVALAAWLAWSRLRAPADERQAETARQPSSWEVEEYALEVQDAEGHLIWRHPFSFPLDRLSYQTGPNRPPLVEIVDLEDDGELEVLFLSRPASPGHERLYCFGRGGVIRFQYQPSRRVRFGKDDYGLQFAPTRFLVTSEPGQSKTIWVVSQHIPLFPATVQKLSSRGSVQGEYWSNGHVAMIQEALIGGRRVLLVGGTSNEHHGASLAVLDYERPSGSAPAANSSYLCGDCPVGRPLAFLIFPQMDVSRELKNRPALDEVRLTAPERLFVGVCHGSEPRNDKDVPYLFPYRVYYSLDAGFQVVDAEVGDDYPRAHLRLELLGRLKHPFGPGDEAELFPVLEWDGEKFGRIEWPLGSATIAQALRE